MIKHGTVHKTPADVKTMLLSDAKAKATWDDITPLARNEWICFMTSGKLAETRVKRIEVSRSKLSRGDRRPCCWPGCPHR
ncbi:MAG: hypothetical protein RL538_516 [Candidatus Parcubacteria bacterium]|jgi:uncharacterized protein YdeI (YjbR/CyaY-like superfamily)